MKLTMVGRLDKCYLLAYRTEPARVAGLLPRGLSLDVQEGHAHWNVVVSHVDRMRPVGTPRALGMSYVHVAYRLYVKARTRERGDVHGLFFVRSDVDRALMSLGGNVMTDFRFHAGDVAWGDAAGEVAIDVRTKDGGGDARLRLNAAPSPDAPRPPPYLKYAPLGLAVSPDGRRLRIADVSRDEAAWREEPVRVREARWALFERLGQEDAQLVSATQVAPLDYRWRIGGRATLAA